MTNEPIVSVIIPAFRADAVIGRAIRSVQSCGLPAEAVEIIVASDDGDDYAPALAAFTNVVCTPCRTAKSGPGAARNRALAIARGRFVALLDADDTWAPSYLSALLPLAERYGVAFSPTTIVKDDTEILRLPGAEVLGLEDLARFGASFRPVARREAFGQFDERRAQDVMHAVELLAMAGGTCPVSAVAYELRLTPGSVTRHPDFAACVETAYRGYIGEIRAGRTRVPAPMREAAVQVFEGKAALNRRFMAQAAVETFYEFVRDLDDATPLAAAS
ncbi:MAG: glycosyltransferase family 2 protein [Pseudomonadota bacterium]